MPLGDNFPPDIVRAQIQPGKILLLDCDFAGKEKFVVVGSVHPRPSLLVINSTINDFVKNRPHLAQCQVKIDQASHDFLSHDSWVACHEVVRFDLAEMHAQVVSDPRRLKGLLSDEVKDQTLSAIKHAPTISLADKQHIVNGLDP